MGRGSEKDSGAAEIREKMTIRQQNRRLERKIQALKELPKKSMEVWKYRQDIEGNDNYGKNCFDRNGM